VDTVMTLSYEHRCELGDPLLERIRLVPKPGTGRVQVEQLAERSGWLFFRSREKTEKVDFEETWVTPDGGAAIHWIEDAIIEQHYISVEGSNPQPVLDLLRAELDLYDDGSLIALLDGTRDGSALMDALWILGIYCWGPFDPKFFAWIRWAMHDPEPVVRRVAVMSAVNAGWPEFLPLLEYVRDHDPAPEVRDNAAAVFDALRQRSEDGDS
jgi:hypothetical protein